MHYTLRRSIYIIHASYMYTGEIKNNMMVAIAVSISIYIKKVYP